MQQCLWSSPGWGGSPDRHESCNICGPDNSARPGPCCDTTPQVRFLYLDNKQLAALRHNPQLPKELLLSGSLLRLDAMDSSGTAVSLLGFRVAWAAPCLLACIATIISPSFILISHRVLLP